MFSMLGKIFSSSQSAPVKETQIISELAIQLTLLFSANIELGVGQ
jgi:hypothetical protein